MKVSIIKVIPW